MRHRLPPAWSGALAGFALTAACSNGPDTQYVYIPVSGGSNGTGGSGSAAAPNSGAGGSAQLGPPAVDSMAPASGPYGTTVIIQGSNLGSPGRNAILAVGNQGEVELAPDSTPEVTEWSETEIAFRFPFPATGSVSIETAEGALLAGEFEPSWLPGHTLSAGPATSALASVSPAANRIAVLFGDTQATLAVFGPDGATEHTVELNGASASTIRLYLSEAGLIEGVGASSGLNAELFHFENENGNLVGAPTGIAIEAEEYALAGGADGAAAWMHRSDGWYRARPAAGGWAEDKGPIADPMPDADPRGFAATSDGSLYIAWAADVGSTFDDMEAPFAQRLPPDAGEFESDFSAGSGADDYITSLSLEGRGQGVVISYCGSDLDPFGVTGTEFQCFSAVLTQGGVALPEVQKEDETRRHAFKANLVASGYCGDDQVWRIRTSQDLDGAPGEDVLFPCQNLVALEIDEAGEFLPVIRRSGTLYAPRRRSTP